MTSAPTPDLDQARRHVALLTGSPNTPICVRLIHDSDKDRDAINLAGPLATLWPEIIARQADGFGAFVVVNEGGHRAADISRVRAAFVDADGVPQPEAWHQQPDFVVSRDPTHWHAYWAVSDAAPPAFKEMQRRLAAHYGTDPAVSDLPRVMRLAGSLHLKDPAQPRLVTLDDRSATADRYELALTLSEVTAGLPASPVEQAPQTPSQARQGRPLPPGEIKARLFKLDPDAPREAWRDALVSLYAVPCSDPDFDLLGLALDWSRSGVAYPDTDAAEIEQIWETMPPKAGGLGSGSFMKLTSDAGYAGPTVGKNDEPAAEVFGAAIEALAGQPKAQRSRAIVLRDEGAQDARPAPSWQVENVLPDRSTVAIHAPFNSYKSFAATDLAMAVASGSPAWGKFPVIRPGPVVYLLGEGAAGFETQRRPAWRIARGIAPDRRLPIYTVEGVPQVRSDEDVAAYVAAVEGLATPPALVVIDTLSRAMAGLNENEAGDASRYLNMVEGLAQRFGCTVLTIMHEGKDESRGARGSSAFSAGFDAVWKMEADTENHTARIVPVKLKDDAGPEPIHLQGRQVQLPNGKGSLVFDWVDRDDYRRANGKNSGISKSEIFAALERAGAVDGKTVSTHGLVCTLAGSDADENTKSAITRSLQRGAKDRYECFVSHLGEGRGDATLWSAPRLPNGEERHV